MPAISEPTTMLTDYALALTGWVFSILLPRVEGVNTLTRRFWSFGFGSLGFAALAGGTFHGFRIYFDSATLKNIWSAILLLIGLSAAFMVAGVIASSNSRHDESTKWLLAGLTVTLIGLAIQISGLSLAEEFNHNDLFHCIQIAALACFYQGARQLQDRR